MSMESTKHNPGKQLKILDATTLPNLNDAACSFRRHSIQPEKTERRSVGRIRRLNTIDYSISQYSNTPYYKNVGDSIILQETAEGKIKLYRNTFFFYNLIK